MQTQTPFISARHNLTAEGFRILMKGGSKAAAALNAEAEQKSRPVCTEFAENSAEVCASSDASANSEPESHSGERSAISEEDSEQKTQLREVKQESETTDTAAGNSSKISEESGKASGPAVALHASGTCSSEGLNEDSSDSAAVNGLGEKKSSQGAGQSEKKSASSAPVNPIPRWVREGVRVIDNGLPRDLALLMRLADPLSVAEAVTACEFDLLNPQSFWDAVLECERRNVGRSETAPCSLP